MIKLCKASVYQHLLGPLLIFLLRDERNAPEIHLFWLHELWLDCEFVLLLGTTCLISARGGYFFYLGIKRTHWVQDSRVGRKNPRALEPVRYPTIAVCLIVGVC